MSTKQYILTHGFSDSLESTAGFLRFHEHNAHLVSPQLMANMAIVPSFMCDNDGVPQEILGFAIIPVGQVDGYADRLERQKRQWGIEKLRGRLEAYEEAYDQGFVQNFRKRQEWRNRIDALRKELDGFQ